jgi:hypothetical protein
MCQGRLHLNSPGQEQQNGQVFNRVVTRHPEYFDSPVLTKHYRNATNFTFTFYLSCSTAGIMMYVGVFLRCLVLCG